MKKGFTLIELLAVIVILAIIALIATPIILGIIEDARKGSAESSANGYIDAVEYQIARNEIKGTETSSGVYDVSNLEVDIDGEKPTSGTVTIEKGNVKEANLCINGYNVIYKNNKSKVEGTCNSLYKEAILNGADPVLKGELVPIVYKNNKTYKADTSKQWYNYSNKEWANAVILFDDGKIESDGEIKEESIKEYYVWIPKYAYRLWNVNSDNLDNVGKPIEIVFGSKAITTGENNGDMYLHPAFDNFKTQGIWVGKFETSYNEETFTDSSKFLSVNPNTESATEASNLIIKPNVRSLSKKNVSSLHTLLFNSNRELNSHMMTNMEWGATAYLTYSVYGRCDNETCTEVTNNNVNTGWYGSEPLYTEQWGIGATITGCAASNVSESYVSNAEKCVNNYNSEKGYLASTTGNITGIYDMSGGNSEYVMGVLIQPDGALFSGQNNKYNSGFKGIYGCPTCNGGSGMLENIDGIDFPDSKYYNSYENKYELDTINSDDYTPSLLGDAIKEVVYTKANASSEDIGKWFNDSASFVSTTYPWITRGGGWEDDTGAGMFSFDSHYGGGYTGISARLVLAF